MEDSRRESSPIHFVVDAIILFLVVVVLTPIVLIGSVFLSPMFGSRAPGRADSAKYAGGAGTLPPSKQRHAA